VDDPLHPSVPFLLQPPPDPFLRKQKAIVNTDADKVTGIAELINRGQQLMFELDKCRNRLREPLNDALSPSPVAWRAVKAAETDYELAYAELMDIGKRLNRMISEEHPELVEQPVTKDVEE
jgi:hypothetical protein